MPFWMLSAFVVLFTLCIFVFICAFLSVCVCACVYGCAYAVVRLYYLLPAAASRQLIPLLTLKLMYAY